MSYLSFNNGDQCYRYVNGTLFIGKWAGAFVNPSDGRVFYVMEVYPGLHHYGPAGEFNYMDLEVSPPLKGTVIIRDRSNERARKELPKITYGEGKY